MTLEEQAAALRPAEIVALLEQNAALKRQVEWCKRQLFGRKSERRLLGPDAQQLPLAGMLTTQDEPADAPPPTETVKAYQRRVWREPEAEGAGEQDLRFDPSVPVEVIALPNPELAGMTAADYEVIGEKVTYRLAQRPGAYVLLQYVRPVLKRKETETLSCPPAPPAVLEKSFADVSRLAGLLLDKFRYHRVTRRQLPQAMGRRKSCCIEDEGRPLGIGLWDQVPNPVKLLCLRGRGVSVDAHVRPRPGR